jgi:hypothetical protein
MRGVPDWNTDLEASFGKFQEGKVQYLYEDLAREWGEDWEANLWELQCEGSDSWEVYSVSVGKPIQRMMNRTLIEGYSPSADGWAQAGMEADNFREFLVPGAVYDIYYSSASIIWFVANSGGDDARGVPNGGWMRGVPDWDTDPANTLGVDIGGMIQFTFDSLVPEWGENWGENLWELQVEGGEAWEVYSMYAGYLYY